MKNLEDIQILEELPDVTISDDEANRQVENENEYMTEEEIQ